MRKNKKEAGDLEVFSEYFYSHKKVVVIYSKFL